MAEAAGCGLRLAVAVLCLAWALSDCLTASPAFAQDAENTASQAPGLDDLSRLPPELRQPLAKAYAPEDLQATLPEDLKREPIDLPQPWIPPDWLGRIVEIMFWLLIGVAALLALFYLGREVPAWLSRQRQLKAGATAMVQGSPLAADGQLLDALGRADRLAAEGQFAEALHLLLLHSIDYLKRHLGARLRSVEHGAGDSAAVALAGRRPESPWAPSSTPRSSAISAAGRSMAASMPPAAGIIRPSPSAGRRHERLDLLRPHAGMAAGHRHRLLRRHDAAVHLRQRAVPHELDPAQHLFEVGDRPSGLGAAAAEHGQAGADQPQQLREEVPWRPADPGRARHRRRRAAADRRAAAGRTRAGGAAEIQRESVAAEQQLGRVPSTAFARTTSPKCCGR